MTTPAKRPRHRPTSLTPAVHEALIEHLEAGHAIRHAAALAGVSERSVHRWLAHGYEGLALEENGEPVPEHLSPFVTLLADVERARAVSVNAHLHNIATAAADGSWQASAWKLERSFPNEYGKRTVVTGEDGGPVRVQVDHKQALREALGIADTDL